MTRATRRHSRRQQLGVAAVELALVLSATMVLLPAVALFGRVFYQYAIMKGASRDAAAYMASVSPTALRDENERNRVIGIAQRIVRDAALEGGMMNETSVSAVLVTCDGHECHGTVPDNLDVSVTFAINGAMFIALTGAWTDESTRTWEITAKSTIPFSK